MVMVMVMTTARFTAMRSSLLCYPATRFNRLMLIIMVTMIVIMIIMMIMIIVIIVIIIIVVYESYDIILYNSHII